MNNFLKSFIEEKFNQAGSALDLGSGDMKDIKELEKLGWSCEGVDKKSGVDLENLYLSEKRPLDLVFSNYVIQFIENKEIFLKTAYDNLKNSGWFFLHTFEKGDEIMKEKGLEKEEALKLFEKQGFKNITAKTFDLFDKKHNHYHKILEIIAQK